MHYANSRAILIFEEGLFVALMREIQINPLCMQAFDQTPE